MSKLVKVELTAAQVEYLLRCIALRTGGPEHDAVEAALLDALDERRAKDGGRDDEDDAA